MWEKFTGLHNQTLFPGIIKVMILYLDSHATGFNAIPVISEFFRFHLPETTYPKVGITINFNLSSAWQSLSV